MEWKIFIFHIIHSLILLAHLKILQRTVIVALQGNYCLINGLHSNYFFGCFRSLTENPETLVISKDGGEDILIGLSTTGLSCKVSGLYQYLCTACLSGSYIKHSVKDEKYRCVSCPAGKNNIR